MMSEDHGIYEIKVINGKKHLIEKGVPSDFDHGVLHKNPLTGKWETNNPVGENFSFDDESGLWQRNEKFGVEKSNGEKGTMERRHRIFGESDYYYEKEKGSTGSSGYSGGGVSGLSGLPDWFWVVLAMLFLPLTLIILAVSAIIGGVSSYLDSPGSSKGKSIVRFILKILDAALMPITFYYIYNGMLDTIYIFKHLGVPRTIYPGWGWAVVIPSMLIIFIILFINEIRWLISSSIYTSSNSSYFCCSCLPIGWKVFLEVLDAIAIVVTFGVMYFLEGVTIFRYEMSHTLAMYFFGWDTIFKYHISNLPNIHTWLMISPFALLVVIILFICEFDLLFS